MVTGTLRIACALLLMAGCLSLESCDEPSNAPPESSIRAMAPDGTHVIVGFPDELLLPAHTNAIAVSSLDGTHYTISSISLDSLSGTLLTATLSDAYDLRMPLQVILTGLQYTRGEMVSTLPVDLEVPAGILYGRDMAPFFAARCNSCHGPALASGNYRTDTREALYAFGSDEAELNRSPNLIPGNERCQLGVKISHKGREFRRASLDFFESELVRQWILSADAAVLPIEDNGVAIEAQTSDFKHVRVRFPSALDSADASETQHYRLEDLETPGLESTPAAAIVESDHPNLVVLQFPDQKLFHRYRLHVDSFSDRSGIRMFDSASCEYQAVLSYQKDIAPLFQRACFPCHGPSLADSLHGFYRTDSYAALFAYGSDSLAALSARNLIPTDSSCLLIVKTRQDPGKTGLCALRSPLTPLESHRISDWIVSYYARHQ